MGEGFVGPLPYTQRPEQPAFRTWATNWSAWDVPRMWDMVRTENNPNGWEQVQGFAQLSGVLFEYYRKLRSHREALHNAWRSPVGEQMVDIMIDPFARSLLSESNCARETAAGLHGIMTTMADAKREMAPLLDRWNTVTIDWIPSWWIPEAGILNHKAQQIMREAEKAISDYRRQIVIPRRFDLQRGDGDSLPPPPPPPPPGEDPLDVPLIPPIPGHRPIIGQPVGFEGATEAELASLPQGVLAVPGQPVSMLPIPPGSPHAPFGGAFILPGPGVGRAGYIVPMPPPGAGPGAGRGGGGVSFPGGLVRPGGIGSPGGAAGAGGMGMMPMPMNAPNPGGQGSSSLYRRRADVVWPVAKGVPPMIQPVDNDTFVPDRPSEKQEEAFEDWFTDMAYPWRKDEDPANRPKVTFRMVDE